jgi:6-phosphogluconolactonase
MFRLLLKEGDKNIVAGRVFYVGSYSPKYKKSIYACEIDDATGRISILESWAGIENPSWIMLSPDRKNLYATSETDEGRVAAFYLESHILAPLGECGTAGSAPCHLAVDQAKKILIATNYTSGSVTFFALGPSGEIKERSDTVLHHGNGPNRKRQECPHTHFASFVGNSSSVWVVDLGLDAIVPYTINPETGKLKGEVRPTLHLPPGTGPRHFTVHPNLNDTWYVVCELSSEVYVVNVHKTGGEILESFSTLPENFVGENTCAAVRITDDSKTLYVSNRGHDSIAVYHVGRGGRLSPVGIFTTNGRTPRDFNIIGEWLVVANQDSDALTVFRIENSSGSLSAIGENLKIDSPACVMPL